LLRSLIKDVIRIWVCEDWKRARSDGVRILRTGSWKGMLESCGGEGQRRAGGTIGAVGGLFNEEGISWMFFGLDISL